MVFKLLTYGTFEIKTEQIQNISDPVNVDLNKKTSPDYRICNSPSKFNVEL